MTTAAATTAKTATARNVLHLKDGRMLGYAEYGDPAGTPVMMFHGFPGSRIGAVLAHKTALARGVRVIAPDRPGFGLSSFQPKRRMLDWPADVEALADALGIDRFAVIGVSGGGPYVAACAYKIPHRLTGAAIVSGVGPMDRAGATDGMMRMNRILFGGQRRLPPLGRAVIWLMGQMLRQADEKGMDRFLGSMPPVDRAIIARPEIRSMLLQDGKEAFRYGARGPSLENGLVTKPWGFRLQDISMEVHLWQGGQDRNVPESHGRYQAQAMPNCRAHFYPDEGHLLVVDRMDEILEAVTN